MKKNIITVIIPVYNSEKYLEKTIKSILEQTYNNYELILIDNGSTDNSAEICKKYQEKDKRVKFYIQSKKGVSNARNMGIEKATGEFICFVDSDDYIEKDMLNSYMDIYIKYKPDLIVSGFFSEVEDIDGKVQMDEIYCDDKNYPNIEEIKKDLLQVNTLFNMQKCFYHYIRGRGTTITGKYIKNLYEIRLKENQEFKEYFDKFGIEKSNYEEFCARRHIERTLGCIENLFNEECNM